MLYDIIPVVKESQGLVEVNSTTFVVDCASLPGIRQAHADISADEPDDISYMFNFTGSQITNPPGVRPMSMLLRLPQTSYILTFDSSVQNAGHRAEERHHMACFYLQRCGLERQSQLCCEY